MTPKRGKRAKKSTSDDARRRVVVHIGLPKTGTTFLQTSLEDNRKDLEKAGLLYPSAKDAMFLAALDVRGTHDGWGRTPAETRGAWERLCRKALTFDGDTLISHELFAAAPAGRVESALERLSHCEVHVVVTTRDLARQSVAEWQESVKHGRRLSFTTFTSKVLADDADTPHGGSGPARTSSGSCNAGPARSLRADAARIPKGSRDFTGISGESPKCMSAWGPVWRQSWPGESTSE